MVTILWLLLLANGLVEAPLKKKSKMKDLPLRVLVVVKTLNLEISRFHLADEVKELYSSACRTCSTTIFPHSSNPTDYFFWLRRCRCRCRRPCVSSLWDSTTLTSQNNNMIQTNTLTPGAMRNFQRGYVQHDISKLGFDDNASIRQQVFHSLSFLQTVRNKVSVTKHFVHFVHR